jgi:hypothetical protein
MVRFARIRALLALEHLVIIVKGQPADVTENFSGFGASFGRLR